MRECQRLDVQDVGLLQQAIDTEAQRMGRQLGEQAGTQPVKALSMVHLEVELLRQLAVDRFDDLPSPVEGTAHGSRHLAERIAARQRQQPNPVGGPQVGGDRCADEGLVPEHLEISVRLQQFHAHRHFGDIGRGEHDVEDHSIERRQQVEFVAKDGLFLGGHPAKARPVGRPSGAGMAARHEVEADDGNRQAVEDALPVVGQIEGREQQPAPLIDRPRQLASAPVEAGALRLVGKQIPMRMPGAEQDRLLIPARRQWGAICGHTSSIST